MIDQVLHEAKLERGAIGCIALGIGPGSYTGIRAAIALGQGWRLATGVKLLAISSALCLAAQAQADGFVGPADFVIDAQRNEFYLTAYDITETELSEVVPLKLASSDEVVSRRTQRRALFGPQVRRWFPEGRELFPRAETLGRLAVGRTDYLAGERIEPIYLRQTSFVKSPPTRLSASH
jgi:tRNA threonylcarbamoyl adenosine modification protein YeaZ